MFNHTDYFQQQADEAATRFGGLGDVGRNVGKWLGFAAVAPMRKKMTMLRAAPIRRIAGKSIKPTAQKSL